MVTFKILYKTDTEIRYEYYPEDDKNSIAGLIGINVPGRHHRTFATCRA